MKTYLTAFLFILFSYNLSGGPGDTIVIQTFEFEGFPVGEGWLAPREGVFDFSEVEGLNFNKILAYYTLKCDDSQNPACGEWDYLSYLQLREHTYTGEHPNFKLYGYAGNTPDSISYMNDVSWTYSPRFESSISYDEPLNYSDYEIGTGNETVNNPFDSDKKDKRTMFLWRASELISAGLSPGDITGKTVYESIDIFEQNKIKKINISNYNPGIYLIRIRTGNKVFNSKFIKK